MKQRRDRSGYDQSTHTPGIRLVPSPLQDDPRRTFVVDDSMRIHPIMSVTSSFYVKSAVLYVNNTPVSDLNLHELPESVWLRFVNPDGSVWLFELARQGSILYGRWLGYSGELLDPGPLDSLHGPHGASGLKFEQAKHQSIMDSWSVFGGWEKLPDGTWRRR